MRSGEGECAAAGSAWERERGGREVRGRETLEVVYIRNPGNGSSGFDLGRAILGNMPFKCPFPKKNSRRQIR